MHMIAIPESPILDFAVSPKPWVVDAIGIGEVDLVIPDREKFDRPVHFGRHLLSGVKGHMTVGSTSGSTPLSRVAGILTSGWVGYSHPDIGVVAADG